MDVYNFDFYEVNSAIMKNAQIYYYKKKHPKKRVGVIVPYYFASLYNSTDEVIEIDKETCLKYGINEYKKITDLVMPQRRIDRKFNKHLLSILSKLPRYFFWLKRYMIRFYKSYTLKEFYISNGLEKFMVGQINSNVHYFRINEYFNIAERSVYPNIMDRFQQDFKYLKYMIENKHLYVSALAKNTAQLNNWHVEKAGVDTLSKYFNARRKVLLRTRNFNTKAGVHNSNIDVLPESCTSMK